MARATQAGRATADTYDLGEPVGDRYHVFSVEWQPDRIVWYIDGIQYFAAHPDDAFLQGKQWVFNHPFFMLMNVAVGGNFGGTVGADTVFPQSMSVDYVRLYQTRPRPVVFNASFRDDFTGWKQISIPFSAFQNVDGHALDLSNIQTLRFSIPDGLSNPVLIDQIRLSAPCDVTVTSTADAGAGSLRRALASVCVGGTVSFSDALAGQTITLLSGPLTLGKNVTIDGFCRARPDAQRQRRRPRASSSMRARPPRSNTSPSRDGYGFQLAGGILNNGSLTLDHVVVTAEHHGNQRRRFLAGRRWDL